MAIRNNICLAIICLMIIPVIRGIANLDTVHSAECLEQSVILIGIILIVPLAAPEQEKAIQEVVYAKNIPQWKILLLRFVIAVIIIALLVTIFVEIMIWNNCTFPFVTYVLGTTVSAMAIGLIGLIPAVLSNSVVVGYLVAVGYFLINLLGVVPKESIAYLFSMENGIFTTKIYLAGVSLFGIALVMMIVKRRKL